MSLKVDGVDRLEFFEWEEPLLPLALLLFLCKAPSGQDLRTSASSSSPCSRCSCFLLLPPVDTESVEAQLEEPC